MSMYNYYLKNITIDNIDNRLEYLTNEREKIADLFESLDKGEIYTAMEIRYKAINNAIAVLCFWGDHYAIG